MEGEKSLDYKQILWVEPTGFMDVNMDVRERGQGQFQGIWPELLTDCID